MNDCIVSYHMNPLTCGVAKFNNILADKLKVPLINIFDPELLRYKKPFISIKCSEFADHDLFLLHELIANGMQGDVVITLFLHDFSNSITEFEIIKRANVTYCANQEIFNELREYTSPLIKLWSPSTLKGTQSTEIGEITIFSFGMAHKVKATYYYTLKRLLENSGSTYSVFLSTALHEGTSFEEAFSISFEQLKGIFGDHIRFLGFLSDDAVCEYLMRTTFFTAFFDKGVRSNNSSVIAAMEAGSVVITNLDEYSPDFMVHNKNVLDIRQIESLSCDKEVLNDISVNAKESVKIYSWNDFISSLI